MRIQNKIKSTYVDITINILVYSFLGFSTCMYVLHMQTHTHTHTYIYVTYIFNKTEIILFYNFSFINTLLLFFYVNYRSTLLVSCMDIP